jgi:hypothetical protein
MGVNGVLQFRFRTIVHGLAALALIFSAALAPVRAAAQDDPFGESEFTSPKFGTLVEWTDEWDIDREQSVIQQRRDLIAVIATGIDAAVLIELQSQRSFRTAEAFLTTAMERYTTLVGYDETSQDLDAYPPSLQFEFGEEDDRITGHIQVQAIENAMMAVVVLGLPGELEDAMDAANDGITVNGIDLLDALPICGDDTAAAAETPADAGDEAASTPESSSSGGSKTGAFGSRADEDESASGDCVEVFVPTPTSGGGEETPEPTPTAGSGRGGGLNNATYTSPSFPGVSLQYSKSSWAVDTELPAEENNGRDILILSHAELPAVVYIETYAGHNGRAGACIDVALGEAGISPGSDEPLTDENGDLIQGSERGRIWGAYAFELELEDGPIDAGGYVECRALPGAAGVLVVTMIVRIETFEDAYRELQPILRSIVLG